MAAKTEKGLKQEIVNLFPVRLRQILEALPLDFARLEEIRLRCGQPILFRIAGKEMGITGSGDLTELGSSGKLDNWEKIREKELKDTLEIIGGFSLYAAEEELRQGFFTVRGGHRIGVAGRVILKDRQITGLKAASFLNVRVAHEIKGCADQVLPFLYVNGKFVSTLIVSPPGCGKTTFLKALIYQYSNQILSIDKQVITEKNKEDYLLHCVNYIDQFGTFFENMKIIEHFEFISQLKKQNFNQNKMLETLYLVGLDAIDLKNYPSSLSIGQRKRFLIALAMFKDASIIIIDEPTASLDQENKEIILNLLQKLKKDNKYIIITTHDDFLIEHLDIIYEIENKQLCCHQEIKEVQQVLKIEKTKHQRIKKYFFYKNQRQWFQFLLVMLLGFIMTVSISINISDSILQENQLANGIERANKAEVYTGKMNDAFFGNDGYFIGDQINNLDISDDELAQMKAIKHVKGVYPFDVFDTINQMQNVSTTSVYFQGNKVNFDYFKDGSPLVAPYYSFQNIKSNGKKLKGNAISQSLANKLGIDKDEKNFKISVEVYIPVQQYSYQGEMNESGLKVEMSQVLTKKVKLDLEVDHIISVDDYYNEFLSAGYTILMPEKSFYSLLNQYNNQTPDSLLDAKELNATITPYHSKNYVIEVDRINNLKIVEKEITKISKNR